MNLKWGSIRISVVTLTIADMITCPACGYNNKEKKHCIRCGCYLPVVLEEPDREAYDFQNLMEQRVTIGTPFRNHVTIVNQVAKDIPNRPQKLTCSVCIYYEPRSMICRRGIGLGKVKPEMFCLLGRRF